MSKTNLEIKCLARLDELIATNDSILEFLVQEELVTREQRKGVRQAADVAKALQATLAGMKGNKIQLISYDWVLLPEERLKVLIVTDRNSREFSFNF
jgi:hypothetical protein